MSKLLFDNNEWTLEKIKDTWEVIDSIGKSMGLDYYKPQIEIISAEQMLEAYSSVAMPIMYNHWSFGKQFVREEKLYKSGQMPLAYEVVINTNPTITYLRDDNTMTMQTLVLAHSICGHSTFFKQNYLFEYWTSADFILDYLKFAKNFISDCEDKYGEEEVEKILDACHAIKYYGIDKYKRPQNLKSETARQIEREDYNQTIFNEIWRTVPTKEKTSASFREDFNWRRGFPEENLLYFIEKNSPILKVWQKELVRIVRTISQYFYPQMQTQVMNEGFATFIHYEIMGKLHDEGYISPGAYLEFLHSHTSVVFQPTYDSNYFSGINVYALGFAMMMDLKRIMTEPTKEDYEWFPSLAGTGDYLKQILRIVKDYKDSSFILQFLSPKVIRDFKLFAYYSEQDSRYYEIVQTQQKSDVMHIRQILSDQYNLSKSLPQIEITNYNYSTDRSLELQHTVYDNRLLHYDQAKETLEHITQLWGFPVALEYVDRNGVPLDYSTLED